ncbi:MAG: sulfurtransferase [Gammaproteobacteria bacterium]|nr:sulfurtransferase [Gammaproteobacteria bacterium]
MAAHLANAEPLLLDVREPWEFDICHIEGSINLPMAQIPQNMERFQDAAEIVVICHHGIRSQRVIQFMQQQLGQTLINLDGGVDAWAHDVDADIPVY